MHRNDDVEIRPDPLDHEHLHRHDDGHHDHVHDPPFVGEHSHVHHHDAVTHDHPDGILGAQALLDAFTKATGVKVTILGAPGQTTGNGILLVKANGTTGASDFTLAGTIGSSCSASQSQATARA